MFEKVKDFLADYTETDTNEIQPDTALSDLGIDSVVLYEMILMFEARFKVRVSDKQIGELFTVQDLVNIAGHNQ